MKSHNYVRVSKVSPRTRFTLDFVLYLLASHNDDDHQPGVSLHKVSFFFFQGINLSSLVSLPSGKKKDNTLHIARAEATLYVLFSEPRAIFFFFFRVLLHRSVLFAAALLFCYIGVRYHRERLLSLCCCE